MTRVVYRKSRKGEEEGILISKYIIFCDNIPVIVHLNPKTFTFKFINYLTNEVVCEGSTIKNLSNLKAKVKKNLKKMGAKFLDEIKTTDKKYKIKLVIEDE
jgi:hypothetical protein